jgi:hydroxymethylglutaryl-CoA lyase
LDLDALVDAGGWISGVLGRPPVSRAGKALLAKRAAAAAKAAEAAAGTP